MMHSQARVIPHFSSLLTIFNRMANALESIPVAFWHVFLRSVQQFKKGSNMLMTDFSQSDSHDSQSLADFLTIEEATEHSGYTGSICAVWRVKEEFAL